MAVAAHAPELASQLAQLANSVTLLLLVYGPDGISKTKNLYVNLIHIFFSITY
jgi:hypothetical protein